jgi:hypothetical protein
MKIKKNKYNSLLNLSFILMILLSLGLSACDTELENNEPFKELIFINGTLIAGENTSYINLTKTLPITEEWTLEKAAIPDAVLKVISEGIEYSGKHTKYGQYAIYNMPVLSGKTYTLTVQWNTKTAYSHTLIPDPPIIDSIIANTIPDNSEILYRKIYSTLTPKPGSSYTAYIDNYRIENSSYIPVTEYSNEVILWNDTSSNGKINLYTGLINFKNTPVDGFSGGIEACDMSLYYYYKSGKNLYSSSKFFVSKNPGKEWNVTGDGIGMLIGKAKTTFFVKKPPQQSH